MAKALTKEQILGISKKHEEIWIQSKASQYVADIRKQAEGQLLEVSTNGFVWTEWISKRYKHLEVALYSELKERLPDCTILVKIQEETWFFCFRYIRLKVHIKW